MSERTEYVVQRLEYGKWVDLQLGLTGEAEAKEIKNHIESFYPGRGELRLVKRTITETIVVEG